MLLSIQNSMYIKKNLVISVLGLGGPVFDLAWGIIYPLPPHKRNTA
jgi:hypothetical protein